MRYKVISLILLTFIFNCTIFRISYSADYNNWAINGGDILSKTTNNKISILGNLLSLAGKFGLFSWDDPFYCTMDNGFFNDKLICYPAIELYPKLQNNELGIFLFHNKGGNRSIFYVPGNRLSYNNDGSFSYNTSDNGLEFVFLGDLSGKPLSRLKRTHVPNTVGFDKLNSDDTKYIKNNYYRK